MSVSEHNNPAAVVLLASEGPARERLRQAVANAGGLIVLDAEPAQVVAEQVLGCHPAAVVIALDASTEQALDALEPVLAHAGVTVLLEEADVAAARQGWDAQRWERHLAAKLQGHANVLPPGAEDDAGLLPEPGRPPSPAQLHEGAPIQAHLAQAMELADTLPVDDGPVSVGLELTDELDLAEPAAALDAPLQWDAPAFNAYDDGVQDSYQPPAAAEVVPSLDELLAAAPPSLALDAEPAAAVEAECEAAVAASPVLPPPLPPLEAPLSLDLAPEPAPAPAPASGGLSQWSLVDFDQTPDALPEAAPAPAAAVGNWDLSGLSLVEEAGDAQADAPASQEAAAAPVAATSVALIMAGIGGPDAIRRLLATLPAEGMPGAVLVQLRLDGGRYANLVTQLERVCSAPVKLAQVGEAVQAGHVYVLGDDITLAGHQALQFALLPPMASVLADLPPRDGAVLMLSGADAEQADAVLGLGMRGAWVAGQSGEGCYDPAAASALAVAGMPVGEPAWLGRELLARWGL